MSNAKAVVLLSGGLDSTTALALAQAKGYRCYTLSFNYGQKSLVELDAAARIASAANVVEHRTMSLGLGDIGGSALTDDTLAVPNEASSGIPITYVPARNTVFLALALGYAEVVGAELIYIGVNAVDYSGYPDCRPEFISAFEQMAQLATKDGVEGRGIHIETPLIALTKAEIIQTGLDLGVDYSKTISCYQAGVSGLACGICDSCRLRLTGFEQCGSKDTAPYVVKVNK